MGYGKYFPEFWITLPLNENPSKPNNGGHISFNAKNQDIVKDFHKIALENGGKDAGL